MDRTQVENLVIELLIEIQSLVSEEQTDITPATKPLVDLAFFDSLLGLEMTVALEEKLGIKISEQSVFCDSEAREPLSVAQIAELVSEMHSGVAA